MNKSGKDKWKRNIRKKDDLAREWRMQIKVNYE